MMGKKQKTARLRRVQLAVPGSNPKMLAKAAASDADHVFCDLEDAVAPKAKREARGTVVEALTSLDWGAKTRAVRINDLETEYCYEDIIEVVEKAGGALDTIMIPKVRDASDILFVETLLLQIETKMGIKKPIGLEALIEEVEALQNVERIAAASPRLECLIFGMGDYSAAHGVETGGIGGSADYPGDIWHYARFRLVAACRAHGLDPVDGPYADFKDEEGYKRECRLALMLGCAGKWAIHPSQIAPALQAFTPDKKDVEEARKIDEAYRKAVAEGLGAVNLEGTMVDAASARLAANILKKADLIGM